MFSFLYTLYHHNMDNHDSPHISVHSRSQYVLSYCLPNKSSRNHMLYWFPTVSVDCLSSVCPGRVTFSKTSLLVMCYFSADFFLIVCKSAHFVFFVKTSSLVLSLVDAILSVLLLIHISFASSQVLCGNRPVFTAK